LREYFSNFLHTRWPSQAAPDPTQNLSFNLNLTPSQQESRARVPLPYVHEGEHLYLRFPFDSQFCTQENHRTFLRLPYSTTQILQMTSMTMIPMKIWTFDLENFVVTNRYDGVLHTNTSMTRKQGWAKVTENGSVCYNSC
jgi:hypothetical protein